MDVFEISLSMVASASLSGKFIRLNDAWTRTLGWPIRDMIGKDIFDFIHPDDIPATQNALARQSDGAHIFGFQNRYRCHDGSYKWPEWTSEAIKENKVIAFARDVTAEKEIILERNRFFDLSLDLLTVANTDGFLEKINHRFTETLGWSAADMTGRPYIDFVHPDDVAATLEEIERQKTGRDSIGFVNRYRAKDGRYIPLEWTARVESDGAVYALARDVTKWAELEAHLQDAKELAEAANRSKTAFLASMSHDLRTPLNAIIGFSSVITSRLYGDDFHEKYFEYASDIHKSAVQLSSLVQDILDTTTIEAGEYRITNENFNLHELIRDAVRAFKFPAQAKRLKLESRLDPKFGVIFTDKNILRRVVDNIISNSVKYTPMDGAVFIDSQRGKAGDLHITISDTGPGMRDNEVAIALSRFGRLNTDAEKANGGVGLGLPLSAQFMKLLNGSLEISSTPGRGTVVTLKLPMDGTGPAST